MVYELDFANYKWLIKNALINMIYKCLIKKCRDVILYAIFGVLTTIVNIVVYFVMAHYVQLTVIISTVIAWILAVLFAYVTNRKWVFHSEAKTNKSVLREMSSFFSCRLATGIIDWGCMLVFVDLMHLNDMLIKMLANIVVIILNYAASKLLIFKHGAN